jgi:hypothetical protein
MNKINIASLFFVLSTFTHIALADVDLKSKEDVAGTWKLESTKNTPSEKEVN